MTAHPAVLAGTLLMVALMLVNRFIKRLPNQAQIPLLLAGMALFIAGAA